MRVRLNPEINVGHIVYVVVLVVGMGAGYGAFRTTNTQTADETRENKKRIEKLEDNAQKTALILREIVVRLNIKESKE